MKTSNKFIVGAFIVFVIALMTYNIALKAEYKTGTYKQPFRDYISYNINGFNEIVVNASEMMHVQIVQGDFAVRKFNRCQDSIKFTRIGNKLVIDIDFKGDAMDNANQPNYRDYNQIIISCPKLALLETNNYYLVNGKKPDVYVGHVNYDENYNEVQLKKFVLDSLLIVEKAGKINLSNNQIRYINGSLYSYSILTISKSNQIAKANLLMNDKSYLDMMNADIPQLNCVTSDSAHINLTGASLKHIVNKK